MTALEASQDRPVRKSAQRLRWFLRAFLEQMEHTSAETGNRFAADRSALTKVFVTWLRAFEAQKPETVEDKAAYVGFAAGLMLRTLIQTGPVTLVSKPPDADENRPAYFWPEGFLYVAFCLNVRGLVIEHDFHGRQSVSEARNDIRTWWSFRENVEEDPGRAIAFLDLFAGEEPDWTMPEIFRSGRYREIASSFLKPMIPE